MLKKFRGRTLSQGHVKGVARLGWSWVLKAVVNTETLNVWADTTAIPILELEGMTVTFAICVEPGCRSWYYCPYHPQGLNTKAPPLSGCILWPHWDPGCWTWPHHCHVKCWSFFLWDCHWHWHNIEHPSSAFLKSGSHFTYQIEWAPRFLQFTYWETSHITQYRFL